MRILGINGSPRKSGNTATLINKALEGAKSLAAETEIIHLYDLDYKGCISCFACKRINGKSYGKCGVKDDLALVLAKVEKADAIIFGSPIYFGDITGEMRCFFERLFFQYLVYDKERTILTPKNMATGFIYTMNVSESLGKQIGYEEKFKSYEELLKRFFGSSEALICTDTVQFEDYSKYVSTMFNVEEKTKRREIVFPMDCQKAFDMGVKLVTKG